MFCCCLSAITSCVLLLLDCYHLLCSAVTSQRKNEDLCSKIHQEIQDCTKTKVQIRMMQQKQLESSKNNELDLLL